MPQILLSKIQENCKKIKYQVYNYNSAIKEQYHNSVTASNNAYNVYKDDLFLHSSEIYI